MIVKARNLAQFGVITDVDAYDLPPGAWSLGVNARFSDGKVQRGPVFRSALVLSTSSPRAILASSSAGFDNLYVGFRNGTVKKAAVSGETDYSVSGYSESDSDAVFTTCSLSRVLYFNREDREPWALLPTASQFVALANWDAGWRCKVLRPFNSSLVALNVTKGASTFPTMVKTSDFALDGSVPPSWDESDPTNNAYENILAEMPDEIVEGGALGERFIIYSRKQTWVMEPTGGEDIYRVRRLFGDAGALNANCAVEVAGVHYVLGPDDIWKHDGLSKLSIADGRVRKFIFGGLDANRAASCFAVHNPALTEIQFCLRSSDALGGFSGGTGCTRAATYNYVLDRWTFDDLPLVFAGCVASLDAALTYDQLSSVTYETMGGSYSDLEGGYKKGLVFAGESSASDGLSTSLYAFDLYGANSVFPYSVDVVATRGLYLERDGLDLDELGENLSGYKLVRSIVPQARLDLTGAELEFSFGQSDDYNVLPTFSDYITYNGVDNRKCDYTNSGRYLSMRVRYDDYKNMALSGLDLDLKSLGQRP